MQKAAPDDLRAALAEAHANVQSLVTLSELHQKRYGHAIPLQDELGCALRHLHSLKAELIDQRPSVASISGAIRL